MIELELNKPNISGIFNITFYNNNIVVFRSDRIKFRKIFCKVTFSAKVVNDIVVGPDYLCLVISNQTKREQPTRYAKDLCRLAIKTANQSIDFTHLVKGLNSAERFNLKIDELKKAKTAVNSELKILKKK